MANPQITPELIAELAGRAQFFFLVQQFQIGVLNLEAYRGAVSPYWGSGVDVFDEMIEIKSRPFPWRTSIRLDFGISGSNFMDTDVEDLEAIKAAYINIWGNVNKPVVYHALPWS